MEMKVKNNKFYLLEMGEEKWLYDSESDAIEALKRLVSEREEVNPEDISILEVDTTEEKWEIKSIPWSKIAIGLMKKKG
jgi:hypothetical protein